MLAKVCSAAVNGIEAYPVEVEVNSAFYKEWPCHASTEQKIARANSVAHSSFSVSSCVTGFHSGRISVRPQARERVLNDGRSTLRILPGQRKRGSARWVRRSQRGFSRHGKGQSCAHWSS
jgi:hypothetical protein